MGTGSIMALVAVPVLLLVFFTTFLVRQYRRCPSNRVLVVYGKVQGQRAAKCLHGGGTFIVPLLQSYAYLNLEPTTIEIELTSALSKKNIRVNVPSTFTIGISTQPDIMNNAAERLLGLSEKEIANQTRDIILGQMRLVIATLSIEEINQDREKFLDLVNKNVGTEVNKIGLELINVNIRDITDESGYIEALGKQSRLPRQINKAKRRRSRGRTAPVQIGRGHRAIARCRKWKWLNQVTAVGRSVKRTPSANSRIEVAKLRSRRCHRRECRRQA